MIPNTEILIGDVRAKLAELKIRGVKVQCCVTSPPYWALRDYGTTPVFWPAGSHEKTGRFPRPKQNASMSAALSGELVESRNARSVWTIASEPYSEAHYATFPTGLVRRCVLAGSRPGDMVLDCFGGSGTTAEVANEYGRNCILIDLNPINEGLMRDRLAPAAGQGVFAV